MRAGLALAFALVRGWDVGQGQVPKAWARISPSCRARGIRKRVFVRQPSPCPQVPLLLLSCPTFSKETFICPRGVTLLFGRPSFFIPLFLLFPLLFSLVPVEKRNRLDYQRLYCRIGEFVGLQGIGANVYVYAVVGF